MAQHSSLMTFLLWLQSQVVMLFAGWLLWDFGLLGKLLAEDVTRISSVALLLFIGSSAYCGYRAWWLSREFDALPRVKSSSSEPLQPGRLGSDYLQVLGPDDAENAIAAEVLAERAKGSHQTAWFLAGVLVKLGLLGTVVGFILMLGSVSGLENLDTSDIKELMQQMTTGMGVAMNTTLVGLVCSMLLGGQCLLLDRAADRLVVDTLCLGQLGERPSGESGH